MFPEKRTDEGWSPFSIQRKKIEAVPQVDPSGAIQINPIVIVSRHSQAVIQPVEKSEDEEAAVVTDVDPKASSATDSAQVSEVDSNENGTSTIPTQNPTHPSSLPPEPETPVDAEKVPSLALGLLTPAMSPGSN